MKWMPRLFSLLVLAFYLSLWFFNEDVRSRPTMAIMFQGLLTIVLLAAWRWEKIVGVLATLGGLLFFMIVTISALGAYDMPLIMALVGGLSLALPYVLTGSLFYISGRELERAQGSKPNRQPAGSAQNHS
jgi:hypothetical protein